MEKEPITNKTLIERAKDSFGTALMSAGIVLVVLVLIWIPFKLIPAIFSGGTSFVSTTLSSLLVPGESTSTPVTKTTTTGNTTTYTNTTSNNTGTTYSNVSVERNYYGKPDLQISLVGTGIIDPATKQFITTNYAGFNDEIAIKFEVKNVGTNVSGQWKLRINAPSRTTPYFDSNYQQSIRPGDRIVFTTTFNSPTTVGINTTYITADPLNAIDEVLENNNELTVPINIQGTYYTYNNNYNYGSYSVTPYNGYGTTYSWSNLSVNCYANPQSTYMGTPITWYATVSGGDGYYTYSWTGTDSLYASESAVNKIYYSSGTKLATVTVNSHGSLITKQCSAYIY